VVGVGIGMSAAKRVAPNAAAATRRARAPPEADRREEINQHQMRQILVRQHMRRRP